MISARHSAQLPRGMTMSAVSDVRHNTPALTDQQEYRLLFAATFGIFLVATVVMRVVRSIGGGADTSGGTSLFAEAKATGYSALAFAFMG